jgi:hypothetical protein
LREKTVPVYSHSYAGRPPVTDRATDQAKPGSGE